MSIKKNEQLETEILARYPSTRKFSEKVNISTAQMYKIINLKSYPQDKTINKICRRLGGIDRAILFPPDLYRRAPVKAIEKQLVEQDKPVDETSNKTIEEFMKNAEVIVNVDKDADECVTGDITKDEVEEDKKEIWVDKVEVDVAEGKPDINKDNIIVINDSLVDVIDSVSPSIKYREKCIPRQIENKKFEISCRCVALYNRKLGAYTDTGTEVLNESPVLIRTGISEEWYSRMIKKAYAGTSIIQAMGNDLYSTQALTQAFIVNGELCIKLYSIAGREPETIRKGNVIATITFI